METTISIKNLSVTFSNKNEIVHALDAINLEFRPNTFNVIIGYSGCGKTTLLRCIAGLQDYTGDIFFNGINADNFSISEQNISFVTQQYTLYSQMTIFDNIAFPLIAAKVEKHEIIDRVYRIAQELDLVCCLTRKPKQISGGQQQRVALARALVKQPSICLLDEPLSNIDTPSRTAQRQFIKTVLKNSNCTIIYVTHDINEALSIADQIFVMDNGKISISGNPNEILNSDDQTVKSLLVN